MDLGIAGRWAIVCASSQGLGRACALALAGEGVNVVVNGRNETRLTDAAAEIRALHPVEVRAVAADIATAAGRESLLAACPSPDILVTNNAGPKPGAFTEIDDADLAVALDLHYFAPLGLVRGVLDGMRERRFGRIVNITSAMVTTPHPAMAASAGARAGLTAVMKGLSRLSVADNVTINQLLPERIDSGRQQQLAYREAEREGVSVDEARRRQAMSIAAGRLGRPEELAAACAFLCSALAGYISGVNLHLDGGSYLGLV
ncbi:SDR family oxidoreductase [Mycolicibacterium sp. CH28]|uniref:SDR family oxidoreductase n=1 Tax=Mycolicibacterium sp. CH28 TaxID=2512237 RepID=UPI00108184A4|nr:SDR family oxidoreductase [Mycolicibacterium sp. CH28]TGD86300.1 SDR family oxidoreductase [Mycolicibacterium sp. CH28]